MHTCVISATSLHTLMHMSPTLIEAGTVRYRQVRVVPRNFFTLAPVSKKGSRLFYTHFQERRVQWWHNLNIALEEVIILLPKTPCSLIPSILCHCSVVW